MTPVYFQYRRGMHNLAVDVAAFSELSIAVHWQGILVL